MNKYYVFNFSKKTIAFSFAMGEVADYLRTLSKHLLEHYQDRNYISNCDDIFLNDNFKRNEKFTHAFME